MFPTEYALCAIFYFACDGSVLPETKISMEDYMHLGFVDSIHAPGSEDMST